mmetsp:Transcript_1529/g.1645  ORF Transcript_1529/g.1645 Transcript_1529/m.1645 type:complete len:574 (+) Transcript_1529:76-1797(+)
MTDQGVPEEPEGRGTANAAHLNNENASQSNEVTISLEELMYSSSSYHAIVKPVFMTMILAALAVTFVQTPSSSRTLETAMANSYTVFDVSDDDTDDGGGSHRSNAGKLGLSLINGLIMVSVIGAMTFVIVLLYKYRCMKFLLGYMIVSSALLLGFIGGLMFDVFIDRYHIPLDLLSFFVIIVNFAAVGTISIFYQKGIPMFMTQTYLVLTSVILAWELSHFNEWTAWTLLVCLAFYDLCAVLTPCGPLKMLVNLMSKPGADDMPGLLYEAELPAGVDRPGRQVGRSTNRNTTSADNGGRGVEDSVATGAGNRDSVEHDTASSNTGVASIPPPSSLSVLPSVMSNGDVGQDLVMPEADESPPTIPLAIALIYRLEIFSPECFASANQTKPLAKEGLSPSQLRAHVGVQFPRRGGKIIQKQDISAGWGGGGSSGRRSGNRIEVELKYDILDRNGNVKRTLVVDEEGRVFEEEGPASVAAEQNTSRSNNSIKLGLGDFIFYSVLVAKASEYSFATFAACTLVILAGLGSTLILLSVYHKALPALPISIFLGVAFYLLTRVAIEPWIEAMLAIPIYA